MRRSLQTPAAHREENIPFPLPCSCSASAPRGPSLCLFCPRGPAALPASLLAETVTKSQVTEIHSFYFVVTLATESWLNLLLGEFNVRIHFRKIFLKFNITILSVKDMSVSQS